MATACCCASSKSPVARWRLNRAHCTPRLYRLEHQGLLDTEWGISDNNRRAKFYSLTAAGRKRLKADTERWNRTALAMNTALRAREA